MTKKTKEEFIRLCKRGSKMKGIKIFIKEARKRFVIEPETEEFNLSKNIEYGVDVVQPVQVELGEPVVKISKIKEFIRKIKEEVLCYNKSKELMFKELDNLTGEKLI